MCRMNRFFCCFLRCNSSNRICCDDTIIEVFAFLTRRELAKFEGVCRAFHQIVDICFRDAPLLFCDRLELDNKLDLDTFLCANAYPLNCYPNFYAQIDITTKFDVFNEHGKRHKIRTKAATENFKKKVWILVQIFESFILLLQFICSHLYFACDIIANRYNQGDFQWHFLLKLRKVFPFTHEHEIKFWKLSSNLIYQN